MPQPPADRMPTAVIGAGHGGSRPGHDLVPLRRAHATTSNRQMQARAPITLIPHPPLVHAVAEAPATKASAGSPSARPVARRHLDGHPLRTRTKREEEEGKEEGETPKPL